MESDPSKNQSASAKKRPMHVMPQEFMASFSDKSSFYTYLKEQL